MNWGKGIVLAFIGFISFILYFVINMNINHKYNHDLVSSNYYEEELKYQEDIDKINNAKKLEENVKWEKSKEGISIIFPSTLDIKEISGKVFLYRPSNKQLDAEWPITLSNHNLLIPDKRLLDGRWNIKVDWDYKGNEYLYVQKINY